MNYCSESLYINLNALSFEKMVWNMFKDSKNINLIEMNTSLKCKLMKSACKQTTISCNTYITLWRLCLSYKRHLRNFLPLKFEKFVVPLKPPKPLQGIIFKWILYMCDFLIVTQKHQKWVSLLKWYLYCKTYLNFFSSEYASLVSEVFRLHTFHLYFIFQRHIYFRSTFKIQENERHWKIAELFRGIGLILYLLKSICIISASQLWNYASAMII